MSFSIKLGVKMHRDLWLSIPIKQDKRGDDVYVFTLIVNNREVIAANMTLGSWTIEEYKRQWRKGLERLKTHSNSCLVEVYVSKNNYKGIYLFSIFKEGNTLYIQPKSCEEPLAKEFLYSIPFNHETCYKFIGHLEMYDHRGQPLDYWTCKYNPEEIDELIKSLK
jgi:hypothetical protein